MKQLVVAGNGTAGVACVEQILKHQHDFDITIFGDETHVNYNRIMLSSVLTGGKSSEEIVLNGLAWYQSNNIRARLGIRVVDIGTERNAVIDDNGGFTKFDKLILATGSSAFMPPIAGSDKRNVHVFRTLDDTRALLEKSRPRLKAVVIGGGLLGQYVSDSRRGWNHFSGYGSGSPRRRRSVRVVEVPEQEFTPQRLRHNHQSLLRMRTGIPMAEVSPCASQHSPIDQGELTHDHSQQSHQHPHDRLHQCAHARVPHVVARVLSLFLRMVRHRAIDAYHPRRTSPH